MVRVMFTFPCFFVFVCLLLQYVLILDLNNVTSGYFLKGKDKMFVNSQRNKNVMFILLNHLIFFLTNSSALLILQLLFPNQQSAWTISSFCLDNYNIVISAWKDFTLGSSI